MTKYDSQGVPIFGFHNPAGLILYPEGLFSYSMGNTRARDLTELTATSADEMLDLLLLASGDVRNILHTVAEMSLRNSQERAQCLNFHLNDYDPTIVARNAVILDVVGSINADVAEDLDFLWNIWYNMALSESDYIRLQKVLSVLAERKFDSVDQSVLRFGDSTVFKECQDIWKDWKGLDLDIKKVKQERRNFIANRFKTLEKESKVKDLCDGILSRLMVGITSHRLNPEDMLRVELKHWFEEGSTNDEAENTNPTLIRPFVHKWKQHYAACPFESYLPVEGKSLQRYGSLTASCKEILRLLVKRYQQYRSNPISLKVTLWTGDALSLCTSGFPPEQLFDVIDTSNVGDHIGLLNVLVCCGPRLKIPSKSILFTSSMLWNGDCQTIVEFYNKCVGVPFHLLPTILGLKLAVDLELGSSKLPDRLQVSEEILCWVKAEPERSILTIGKNSDILEGLLVLLERCFNLPNITDAKVYGATLSSPLTFLRIVYQIQPIISGGATCIFELLQRELPDDFQQKFGLSWNLLKASVGIKPEPIVEIQVATKIPLVSWFKGTPIPHVCITTDREQFESTQFQQSSKIYNSLRYDDKAGIVTFHLREQDWDQLNSRGLMWFSSLELITVASLSSTKIPLEVIECHKIFLGDERVKNIGQVDPIQTFGLFSVQLFNIEEANNVYGNTLKVLKMEESQFFYSAELAILDPLRCKAANMKINFQPDMHATKVTIDFDEAESERNKTDNSKNTCILCFSCSVDANLSKFQISRKQGKIFCHIPKKEEGTVGELVIRCPAPVPFHSLSEWDVGLDDTATILGSMYRTKDDQQLKCTRQSGPPFFDLRESISMIFNGFMRESKTARTIYCIDERGVIEQPYQTPDDMANKKGFVVKVQKIYKWKNLPVAKVLFFDCQQFSEKFRDVLTAEETMRAFLSEAWFSRVERILASEQEKALFRKLLYTNAGRVLQSNDCELWKHSFLSPLFPRESTKGCFEIMQTVQQFLPEGTSSFPEHLLQQDMNPSALLANHQSDSPSLAELECAFCHSKPVEPLKKCLGCKKVFYCRKECQTKHWRDHKAYCRQHKT
ncbi:uncharacterized protein LOC114974698 [Acropora millepora]|uniref:uncharacterized protein LOC114974698 n=1 Tax=Acropora millepora TaxID=45264 RepID=UPI001CF3A2C8|nr:uncharacterized protein LOC114974698 [Acropora millepora]